MKKTLTVRTPGPDATPAIQKKGRGWEISEKRLDALHERAREMRRNPTPAQDALTAALGDVETGGYSFKRQAVIGSAIVDFACKPLMLVIELEGDEDAAFTATRDRSLTEVGYRVERIAAEAVLADPPAAAAHVSSVMRERWHERRANRAHSGGAPQRHSRGQ
ncbi:MAG: endonuclease domain-containing protein [Novosphingobium sp.]